MTHIRHSVTHDVVVVGARVAGAATAMLLARRGLSVVLLDRRDPAADTLSTHALMRGAVLQLARWDLLGSVAAGTAPIERVTFQYDDERETVDLLPRGGPLYAPRRTLLDPLLVTAARDAGADVRIGWRVEDLLTDHHGRVTGVVAREPSGQPSAIRARVTVGADGLGSIVARHTRAPYLLRGTASTAVAYRYTSALALDGYDWRYRPGVAAGLIPTGGGLTCVWAGATTARFLAERHVGLERWFAATLTEAAPDIAPHVLDDGHGSRLRGWAGRPGFLRRPWGPGWLLVGDAGSFTDPISAHGITDALRDAEYASHAVGRVLTDGHAEHEAFATFHQRRDELAVPVLVAADAVAGSDGDVATRRTNLLALSDAMRAETRSLVALDDRPPTANVA